MKIGIRKGTGTRPTRPGLRNISMIAFCRGLRSTSGTSKIST
jgi:hypothetical protein